MGIFQAGIGACYSAEEVVDLVDGFDEPCFDSSNDDLSAEELDEYVKYCRYTTFLTTTTIITKLIIIFLLL